MVGALRTREHPKGWGGTTSHETSPSGASLGGPKEWYHLVKRVPRAQASVEHGTVPPSETSPSGASFGGPRQQS